MKNIIVQIYIDKRGWEEEEKLDFQSDEVLILSNILTRYYAYIHNAEYLLIRKPVINFKHPTWERFQLFSEKWVNNFSNILYLDTDIFPWPNSPNIFSILDQKAFNIARYCFAGKDHRPKNFFNAGVFALNKLSYMQMKKFIDKNIWIENYKKNQDQWDDQYELNDIVNNNKININWIDEKWNFKNHHKAYFTHLWGRWKKTKPDMLSIKIAKKICTHLVKEKKYFKEYLKKIEQFNS